jgi:hypothetical protein
VKKVHMRDRTLDLYSQRVTTADGVVYEVDANLVFRIEDPIKAAVNIDHIRSGCETVLALRVQELFKKKTWEEIQQGRGLNEELQALVQVKLQDWGIVALRADFTSLSPSLRSLPLTQFHLRVEKRKNLLRFFQASPLPTSLSLTLLAPEHLPQSHSHHCYHEIQYQRLQERRYQRHKARKDSTDWGLFL